VLRTAVHSLGLALERAEQARQLTAQRDLLQASNEELEAFTYSVSHDLQTPVRHIISFGNLLRRSLPEPRNVKTERYLGIISTAADTLNTLINGMLDVSRTARRPLKAEQVELNRLFQAARQAVGIAQSHRQIDWRLSPLPTVRGDVELLRRVITALVDNAVKYTRDREWARIEVWAEDRGASWAVQVRDNGVGFNPQYRDKLFSMFQRLHRPEEFEGAAVSLANARRIVTRHGGTMTAEGQAGVGATFGFVLPKAPG
jgi:light-regulated signal transduction histidine kinase (bacteriophytochrome)